jgi:hypothetical protein
LTGLQQDEKPPQFNIRQQFNDKVPFNFASGEVGISGQPREPKAQVSLTRAGDGSAKLSVGDSTFVNFKPGQRLNVCEFQAWATCVGRELGRKAKAVIFEGRES